MKHCKDCKHHREMHIVDIFSEHKCTLAILEACLITGKVEHELCDVSRNDQQKCGKEAKWFEEKQKWWRFWK